MATIKRVWTENVNLRTSAALAAGASATNDIDLDNLGADIVDVTIEIAFGSSPDGNAQVDVYISTDSGTNDDTEPMLSFRIAEATSTTKRKTFVVSGVPYIAVKVTNNDSADNVTYDSWYAWANWNSA